MNKHRGRGESQKVEFKKFIQSGIEAAEHELEKARKNREEDLTRYYEGRIRFLSTWLIEQDG